MKTGDRLTAARLLRFHFRFLGGTHVKCVRAAVKTAVEKEQRREGEACPRQIAESAKREGRKSFPSDPLTLSPLGDKWGCQ